MGSISHQLGLAKETVWGTSVTPTRFLEFTSESLERRQNVATSAGIRAGRRYGGQGRRITSNDAGGSITTEVAASGFGLMFEQLLGSASVVVDLASTVWSHTFVPGELTGKSLTIQKGVEKPDGTVQAFTYPGSKIVSADFSIDQDGMLMANWGIDAKNEVTGTALATASYTAPIIFTYSEGAVKVGGVTKANVRSVGSLQIVNNLLTDRRFLGNTGLKSEQTNVPFDAISGNLDVEFQNLTDFYDLFIADTSAVLVLEFIGPVISGAHNYTLRITVNDVRFEGETPQVGGPELVYQNIPFVGLDPAAGDAVSILYKTNTATP